MIYFYIIKNILYNFFFPTCILHHAHTYYSTCHLSFWVYMVFDGSALEMFIFSFPCYLQDVGLCGAWCLSPQFLHKLKDTLHVVRILSSACAHAQIHKNKNPMLQGIQKHQLACMCLNREEKLEQLEETNRAYASHMHMDQDKI